MGHSGQLPPKLPMTYPACEATRKTGEEPFVAGNGPLGATVADFWRWAVSDLVENTTRGLLAEFLVAQALGVTDRIRCGWDPFDLTMATGIRIEVKSCAYLQAWDQRRLSRITFSIGRRLALDPEVGDYRGEAKRYADVYVFALLHHQDKRTLNPLDLTQWTFYVLPTALLECAMPTAKSISLAKLKTLGATEADFSSLGCAIEALGVRS